MVEPYLEAKPSPRIAPCCVSSGMDDTLDLGGKRPLQGQQRASVGRENG